MGSGHSRRSASARRASSARRRAGATGTAATVRKLHDAGLVAGLDTTFGVWMSHGDVVEAIPDGFVAHADTDSTPFAAIADESRRIYGVQFHPEVHHTPQGKQMLRRFLFDICGLSDGWNMADFLMPKFRSRGYQGKFILPVPQVEVIE